MAEQWTEKEVAAGNAACWGAQVLGATCSCGPAAGARTEAGLVSPCGQVENARYPGATASRRLGEREEESTAGRLDLGTGTVWTAQFQGVGAVSCAL